MSESEEKTTEEQGGERPSLYVRKSSGLIRAISARDALLSNLIGMGILVNIFWVVYASALYPNADLPSTVFVGLLLNLLVASVYWMLATAMPRTGGDYIYVSRIIHPAVGFMANAMFVAIMVSWAGLFPQLMASQGLQMMFANLASATGNQYYLQLSSWLSSQAGQFEVGAVIVTIVILLMLLPTKWLFRFIVSLFIVQAIIFVWFIAALVPVSHSDFVNGFSASGTTVNNILSQAAGSGVSWTITLGGTLTGIVYTMLSYIGYANSAYFAGEVKGNPARSQGIAIPLSTAIFAVIIYILYTQIYRVFGHDFLVAASSLATSGSSSWYNYANSLPSPAYLISFISHNPYFVAAVPLGLALTFFGFAIVYFFIPVRNIFAWAFDRIIPLKFSDVTKSGVPYLAIAFYGAIAYISLYLTVYTPVFGYLAYSNFGWWLAVAIVMFSAAIFPFRRKELFETSPSIVKKRLAGVPLITILGVVAGLLSLFVSYSTILPSFTGIELNPVYVASMLIIFLIAVIIYAISHFYHKAKGLPLDLISKELPPT
ncbi:MAG: amino acid permease [Conexivisphaerales archaeon]